MLKRVSDLIRILKGDYIVLSIDKDKLIVEAENFEKEKLREVASTFFQHVYNL